MPVKPKKGRLQSGQPVRRRRVRRKKKRAMTWYRACILCIVIFGSVFICSRLYELWLIHEDMQQTLQQEQKLSEENQQLKEKKDRLNQPDEVEERAREQFGLAKSGEIPYQR